MADYNLGNAHGKINLSYAGDGVTEAIRDLEALQAAADNARESLERLGRALSGSDDL